MSQENLQKQIDELNAVIDSPESTEEAKAKASELVTKLMDVLTKRLALEAQTLELQERKYHIQDLKSKIEDREIKDKQVEEDRAAQGRVIAMQDAADVHAFSVCSHRKGGMASPRNLRVLREGGNAAQYAVIKHQMINGDIWVRCLRCGKTWNPPVENNFFFDKTGKRVAPKDGEFNKAKYEAAIEEYKRATMFETNNSMSTSVQCRFSYFDKETGKTYDGADKYRENIASTTLR